MDDNMRAKARAVFGKEFMDIMQPKPLAKNAAVALQQRANARPIPTYKVGGAVKKACGPMPKAGKVQKKADGGVPQTLEGSGNTAPTLTQSQAMATMPSSVQTLPAAGKMTPTQPGFKSPGKPSSPMRPSTKVSGLPTLQQEVQALQALMPGSPAYQQQVQYVQSLPGGERAMKSSGYSNAPQNPGLNPVTAAPTPEAAMLNAYRQAVQTAQPLQAAKKGGKISKNAGLYANINAKRERIEAGSGEKMRKPGSKGAPTDMAFAKSKISKKADGGTAASTNEDIRNRYRDMLAGKTGRSPERAAKVEARQDRRADREAEAAAKRAARQSESTARRAEAEAMRKSMQEKAAEVRNETRKVPDTRPAPQGGSAGNAATNRQPSGPQPGSYATAYGRQAGPTPTRPGFPSGASSSIPSWVANAGRAAANAAGLKKGGKASKKMNGGPIADNMTASKLSAPKPEKYAQGGAGKVRKGMMTQSGQITPGKRGKGSMY